MTSNNIPSLLSKKIGKKGEYLENTCRGKIGKKKTLEKKIEEKN